MARNKRTSRKKTSTKAVRLRRPKSNAPPVELFELKVTLLDIDPPIWRRIEVPSDFTLEDLHDVLQVVMGWDNSHLHQFMTRDGRWFKGLTPFGDELDSFDDGALEGWEVHLYDLKEELKEKMAYEYDFGDGWMHEVKLVEAKPADQSRPKVRCLAGDRACPPDDCGGTWGYQDLLDAFKNPKRQDDEMLEWLGDDFDPEAFDVDNVNRRFAHVR